MKSWLAKPGVGALWRVREVLRIEVRMVVCYERLGWLLVVNGFWEVGPV